MKAPPSGEGKKRGPSAAYAVAQRGGDWRARIGIGRVCFGGAGVAAIAEAHATVGVEPLRVGRREAGLDVLGVVGPLPVECGCTVHPGVRLGACEASLAQLCATRCTMAVAAGPSWECRR